MNKLPPQCDVAIVGSGPAGLSTAIQLKKLGVSDIVVLERSEEAGGNPRHCGHSPFGFREFKRIYLGPAYARKIVETARKLGVRIALNTSVTSLGENGLLTLSTPDGKAQLQAKNVVLTTGTREMPRAPRFVSGQRPLGVVTTGALQSMVYLSHKKPFQRPVIVGSELVAFSAIATCRHIGIKPVAMLENNPRVTAYSALQLLPRILGVDVLLNTQILDIEGKDRVTGVNILTSRGEKASLQCDGVIFTGKFIPEASLARMGHLGIDPRTQGPVVDQFGRCTDPAYFAAGNVLRPVETGGWCWREGETIAPFIKDSLSQKLPETDHQIPIEIHSDKIKYVMPQKLSLSDNLSQRDGVKELQLRFNVSVNGVLRIKSGDSVLYMKKLKALPERRILIPVPLHDIHGKSGALSLTFEEVTDKVT